MDAALARSPTSVSQLYMSDEVGHFALAGRVGTPTPYVSFVEFTTGPEAFERLQYTPNPHCIPFNFSCQFIEPQYFTTKLSYSATKRPWFVTAEGGVSSWTSIYFFQQTGQPGITGVDSLINNNGTVEYVAAVDISLSSIGEFLRSLTKFGPFTFFFFFSRAELSEITRSPKISHTSSTGLVFIADPTGSIIACGAGLEAATLSSCQNINGYNKTSNSTVPLIVTASRHFNWSAMSNSSSIQYFSTPTVRELLFSLFILVSFFFLNISPFFSISGFLRCASIFVQGTPVGDSGGHPA